jgi:hypothetical protein
MSNNKARITDYILYFIIILFVFFYPTSSGGVQYAETNMRYIYTYYGIAICTALVYMITNGINVKRGTKMVLLFVYLSITTILARFSISGQFVIARLVFTIIPAIVLSVDTEKELDNKVVLTILELITIIILIWNIGLIFNLQPFTSITNDRYSQFNSFTTSVFVSMKRPIFTFGVYSYSAYFYSGLFVIWIAAIRRDKRSKIRYYFYEIMLIIYQLLLRGSTALMLGGVMIYTLLKTLNKRKWGLLIIPIFLVLGTYYINSLNYDWNRMIIGTESNGFFSRYFGNVFVGNFEAIKTTIFGIGWTVIRSMNIRYTDSGYIVLATMGSIIMPVLLYWNLHGAIKNNLPVNIRKILFAYCMLFEIALPSLLYPRAVIFLGFVFISIRSIYGYNSTDYNVQYDRIIHIKAKKIR